MKKLLVFLCLLVAGCAVDPRIVAFEAGKKQVNVDKRILEDCPELGKLSGRSEEEVTKFIEQVTNQYKECKVWKGELNHIAKDAFNTEKK
jgi:hypothetical protein